VVGQRSVKKTSKEGRRSVHRLQGWRQFNTLAAAGWGRFRMALFHLRMLGTFDGTLSDGRRLRLPTRKSRALLAYLALHAGEACDRGALAALLWADRPEPQARRSLRQALHEIRAALDDSANEALTATRDSAALDLVDVDVIRFERLASGSRCDELVEADRLYRGNLLEGFDVGAAFDNWLYGERERLQEIAVRVLKALAEAYLRCDHAEAALRTARRLVRLDDFDESAHRLLMRALVACGRRNEALKHYDRLARLLRDELSVAPAAETRMLRDSLGRVSVAASRLRATGFAEDEKPAIAVLPFRNLSGDTALDALAEGVTEDLTTALCRTPYFLTIASDSLEGYRQTRMTLRQAADELGVRYVVAGSVQKGDTVFRISAQVIDASTGLSLWGGRFDRPAAAGFELQDEIIVNILVALEVKVGRGDLAQIYGRRSISLEAWLLNTQARSGVCAGLDQMLRAREVALAARDLAPAWEMPWGVLAHSYWVEAKQGWAVSRRRAVKMGVECAEKAIECNPGSPEGYMNLGNLAYIGGDHDAAMALVAKAARLGPSNRNALYFFGRALLFSGQTERGLALYRRALEGESRIPSSFLSGLIYAELAVGNTQTAAALAERITQRKHTNPLDLIPATASFVAAGRPAKAEETVTEILRIGPTVTIGDWRSAMSDFRDRSIIDRFSNLLTQVGLPS
jgi:DNA-binding SARP family transcriptional activator